MKNFVPRCLAAMAGNGAILITIGNYVASEGGSEIVREQAPLLGGLFVIALLGVVGAYSALDLEGSDAGKAARRLKWSARLFFISMLGFGLALISTGL